MPFLLYHIHTALNVSNNDTILAALKQLEVVYLLQ